MKILGRSAEVGPSSERTSSTGADPESDLFATIQDRIIPQLIVAHLAGADDLGACPDTRLPPTPQEVAAFACAAVAEDLDGALRFIRVLADGGLSMEVILIDLVAAAARLLGEEWQDDRRSLTEVTVGMTLLHRVVHVLGPSASPSTSERGSVVLVAAPNEQHTLGLFLLAEFLRRERWAVHVDPSMPASGLFDLVRREHIDLVGISVSNTDLVRPLKRLVAAVRSSSVNKDIAVVIGGSLAMADQAAEIGATFIHDPREAVALLARQTLPRAH